MIGAWFRLAFVAACSAYIYGLVYLAHHAGVAIAVLVGVLGPVVAVLLSEDWQTADTPASGPRVRARSPRPWRRTGPYEGE